MFTIYGGATEFNQWGMNQRVSAPGLLAGDKVIFQNSSGMTYPMKAYTHNGVVVADVPNIILTMALPVVVYINDHCHETRTRFNVVAQNRPDDYVFVDNDDWPSDSDVQQMKPAFLDLSQFGCLVSDGAGTTAGYYYNQIALELVGLSMASGGTLQKRVVTDRDGGLKQAANAISGRSVMLRCNLQGDIVDIPTVVAHDNEGVGQLAASMIVIIPDAGIVDGCIILQFMHGSNKVTMQVKAAVIGT